MTLKDDLNEEFTRALEDKLAPHKESIRQTLMQSVKEIKFYRDIHFHNENGDFKPEYVDHLAVWLQSEGLSVQVCDSNRGDDPPYLKVSGWDRKTPQILQNFMVKD